MALTDAELDALPEIHGVFDDIENVTDPETGLTSRVRKPVQFLVSRDDVLFYTDRRTGDRWRVVEIGDGRRFKQRVNF